ncbi:MAG TPA: lamin tail domain-containing protein [Hymenobacter sp.]
MTAFPVYAATAPVAPILTTAAAPGIIITEFQTNGGAAAKEFIELYNNTDEAISFDTGAWHLQFFSSTHVKSGNPAWAAALTANNSIALTGTIDANDYFVIASTDYAPADVPADMTYAAASSHLMTDTGGGLQLVQAGETAPAFTVHDRVMWLAQSGTAVLPQDVLASPAAGKSLQRIPNDDQEYLAADGILSAFGPADSITPLGAWAPPVVVAPDPVAPDETEAPGGYSSPEAPGINLPIINQGLAPPTITELLPNPASPLTDADDEFIELYNANSAAFDLGGYKLEVGTTTLRSYAFPETTVIQSLQHRAFSSAETGLSLSNSGTIVRLKAPDGQVVSETIAYGTAKDGQSWIYADGTWQWSSSATPSLANIIAVPVAAATKASAAAAKKAATATAKTTAAKTTKAKTTKIKAVKKAVQKKAKAVKAAAVALPAKPKPPIHMGILVAVVSVAVLYGLYEYRHDIALKLRQLGRNRKSSVPDRFASAGR